MGLFQRIEPTFIKESSNLEDQIEKLREILPKASPSVQKAIEKDLKILEAGLAGEKKIIFELKNSHLPIYVLHDIYLKYGELSAQIDFMVIAPKHIYILECKNLIGNIEINSKGEFTRTVSYGTHKVKEGIYSPITQNARHLELIKAMKTDSRKRRFLNSVMGDVVSSIYKAIVVIANDKAVVYDRYAPQDIKKRIIKADGLIEYIKNSENNSTLVPGSDKEMREIAESWLSSSSENNVDYLEKYRDMERELRGRKPVAQPEKNDEPATVLCPVCGAPMILRTAGKGDNVGHQFWGCSNYPNCKGTRKASNSDIEAAKNALPKERLNNRVEVGTTVTLYDSETGDKVTYKIVPVRTAVKYKNMGYKTKKYVEVTTVSVADGINSISEESPIGKKLIGKKQGDKISYEVNNQKYSYIVLEVSDQ